MTHKLSVQRCFHPVGQGAFYSEKFIRGNETYYMVYDCGTSTGKKKVNTKNIIEGYFPPKNGKKVRIPFLFISHFDRDHISGIQHVLEYCDVDYLFLPLITNTTKLMLLADTTPGDVFYIELICNAEEIIRLHGRRTRVIYVRPSDSENEGTSENLPSLPDLLPPLPDLLHGKNEIDSGTFFSFSHNTFPEVDKFAWCFSPFHYEFADRSKKFINCIGKAFGIQGDDLEKIVLEIATQKKFWLKRFWLRKSEKERVETIRKIKKEFDKIGSGANNTMSGKHVNNMSLYSGPYKNGRHDMRFFMLGERDSGCCCAKNLRCCNLRCCVQNHDTSAVGAVYTGDYEAKTNDMMGQFCNHFYRWKDNIGILQLPHHGSRDNCLDLIVSLLDKNNSFNNLDIFVVSFGLSNQYHHPSPEVITELLRHGKEVYFAHEGSGVIQNIEKIK